MSYRINRYYFLVTRRNDKSTIIRYPLNVNVIYQKLNHLLRIESAQYMTSSKLVQREFESVVNAGK